MEIQPSIGYPWNLADRFNALRRAYLDWRQRRSLSDEEEFLALAQDHMDLERRQRRLENASKRDRGILPPV
jgi:hypothetical protein